MIQSVLLLGALGLTQMNAFVPVMSPRARPVLTSSKLSSVLYATANKKERHCIPLQEIGLDDLPKVGGKTASLGEMIQELTPLGVDVPGGFGVSSTAYDAVLDRFNLRERLQLVLDDIDGKFQKEIFICYRSFVNDPARPRPGLWREHLTSLMAMDD